MSGSDLYVLLGVRPRASVTEIARAYRLAARSTHPDRVPGDPSAAERFRRLTDAYETLSDPVRRAAYDRAHPSVTRPAAESSAAWRHHAAGVGSHVVIGGSLARRPPLWAGPVQVSPPAGAAPITPRFGERVTVATLRLFW